MTTNDTFVQQRYYQASTILAVACGAFGVTLAEIMRAPRGVARISDARQGAAYLLMKWGSVPPCDVNRMLDRGFQWAYYTRRNVRRRMEVDKWYRATIDRAEAVLTGKEVAA